MRSWFLDHTNKLSLCPRALIIMAHTKLLCFAVLSQRDDACGFTLLHSHHLLPSPPSLWRQFGCYQKTTPNANFSNANGVVLISGNITSPRVVIGVYFYRNHDWDFGCHFVNIKRDSQNYKMLIKTRMWSGWTEMFLESLSMFQARSCINLVCSFTMSHKPYLLLLGIHAAINFWCMYFQNCF